jgi:hypothetical protein
MSGACMWAAGRAGLRADNDRARLLHHHSRAPRVATLQLRCICSEARLLVSGLVSCCPPFGRRYTTML